MRMKHSFDIRRHYLALTLDMSGVLELTPGAPEIVWVVSRLEDEVLILSLGRERLPGVKKVIKLWFQMTFLFLMTYRDFCSGLE